MISESHSEGAAKAMTVRITVATDADGGGAADAAGAGGGASSGDKRKAPHDGFADRDDHPPDAHGATEPKPAAASSARGGHSGAEPSSHRRREFLTRLGKCAKNNDAQAATALFQELVDSGVSCTAQICATFIHILSLIHI